MADKKKHFYVVIKGRKPGVYTQWSGPGGAEEQIKGFPGAVFKGFATRQQADYYARSGGKEPPALFEIPVDAKSEAPAERPADWDAYRSELAAGKVVLFTDGASTHNPGPGGYGVVLLFGEARKELSGGFRCTTNNRMELMGVIAGLRTLTRRSQVVIYSDSRYVVQGIEKGWARRWKANGWMRAPDSNGGINRAENVDLWSELLGLLDQHDVAFRWVKGHASHPENERCDQLAVQAAKGRSLPDDPGYEGKCK